MSPSKVVTEYKARVMRKVEQQDGGAHCAVLGQESFHSLSLWLGKPWVFMG